MAARTPRWDHMVASRAATARAAPGRKAAAMDFMPEFIENLVFVAISGLLFLIVVVGDGSDAMESRGLFGRHAARGWRARRGGGWRHARGR